jgi:cbb3-type cytochrome oxidase maturation protein
MNEATIAQTIMTLGILVIFIGLLVWGIKSRQFHDIEEPKYRMLAGEDGADKKKEASKPEEKKR